MYVIKYHQDISNDAIHCNFCHKKYLPLNLTTSKLKNYLRVSDDVVTWLDSNGLDRSIFLNKKNYAGAVIPYDIGNWIRSGFRYNKVDLCIKVKENERFIVRCDLKHKPLRIEARTVTWWSGGDNS